MFLDLALFGIIVFVICLWADEYSKRRAAERTLTEERALTDTLGRANAQLRERLQDAEQVAQQNVLSEWFGKPGPKSGTRRTG